jgi:hypothetical protein
MVALLEHQPAHRRHPDLILYKSKPITDIEAHDLIIRATDIGVCSNRAIPTVLNEWRSPRHPEFEPRSTWSLYNSVHRGAERKCTRGTS